MAVSSTFTCFCFWILLLLKIFVLVWAQEPTILLPQGEIRGIRKATTERNTVVAFLGIPYAQPPVNDLRFKLPQAILPSNRSILADRFRPACPQPNMDRLSTSEDCLYVNVWIPEMPIELRTYPVLVFLEGEMFTHSNPAKYPAEDLAAEGLVIVSIHYRLNIFGFLSLGTREAPGNLGLWDQNMALRWVQNNIGKFGGDPKQVTLMGHGAGGASVTMHMTAAPSKGLFERAIVMSGTLFGPWAISRHPRAAAVSVSLLVGCRAHSSDTELLACLRNREYRDIVQAFVKHQKDLNTTEIFSPVIDTFLPSEEAFLGRDPIAAYFKGDFHRNVRVITGVAESEGAAMFSVLQNLAKRSYDELSNIFRTASIPRILDDYGFIGQDWHPVYWTVRYHYYDQVAQGDKAAMLHQMLQLYGDAYYKSPHDRFVSALLRYNVPTYIYRYAYSDPLSNGTAPHGSELLYLFGPTVYRQEIGVGFSRTDENVGDLLKRLWLEFAQGGDPTPNNKGFKWEPSVKDNLKNYEIGEQLSRVPYPKHKVAFWNEYLPIMVGSIRGEISPYNVSQKPFDSKYRTDPTQPYQSIMWVLIAAISVILVAFILSMASMRSKRPLV